jgi:hypothetical protein
MPTQLPPLQPARPIDLMNLKTNKAHYLLLLFIALFTGVTVFSQQYWQCCNCASLRKLNPTGAGTDLTLIKVCDSCKNKRCFNIATAQDPISKMIDLNFHTPDEPEWKKLLAQNKPTLKSYLESLQKSYCDDQATMAKIEEMLNTLKTLDPAATYTEGQVLKEREKIAGIDLGLKELGGTACKSNTAGKKPTITCPPGSSKKEESDNEELKEYLKDKLKQAGETVTDDTNLGDLLEKYSKGQQIWGFYNQIMAATCISPEMLQALHQYIQAKKVPGEDLSDECNTLCSKMADWYAELTGDPRMKREFMIACWNKCR